MARKRVTTELRKAKYIYEKDLSEKIKSENKLFWSYDRSKTKTKTVSRLKNAENELSKSNQETADILNEFFASVFEVESEEPLPEFQQRPYENQLSSIVITEEKNDKIISNLNAAKSRGPYNIHPKLLKETKSVITKPLKILFQKSVNEGKLPEVWKLANVTPIFKKRE